MKKSLIKTTYFISLLFFIFGCEYERIAAPETICETAAFELVIESVQNTSCAATTGEIVVNVNGEEKYLYRLNDSDYSDNNVFTDLGAGNYTVQAIIQDTQCASEPIEVSVENEDGIQISLVEKNDSECGGNSGSIIVSQEDGIEPIEYLINGTEAQESPEFTGLASGDYTILARDANGCEAEISGVEIYDNISFSSDIKPIIATNCAVNGCHNGTQSPNFTIDSNIIQNASRIKSRTESGTMPPPGRQDLTADEIEAIACWVDGGALDN